MVASIGVTVLGSTGSIGVNTLDVIARQQDKYHVVALTANTQVERLLEQCKAFNPKFAVLRDADSAHELSTLISTLDLQTEVLSGIENLEMVASLAECSYVMAAIVGAAGLRPTLAAAKAGKRVLLANKEALVMSGDLFMQEIKNNGAQLLPIDSEHNAIFQCMPAATDTSLENLGIRKILLTASGGPFRTTPLKELTAVTPEQACAHPNWVMGRKISVDSATMMNKGLELIEACWLFNTAPSRIQVVIHPQSVIHSMVEYVDGSVLAQLGNPDMRTPIAHALAWPERMLSGVDSLDIFQVARLDFEPPDLQRFPCLRLSMEVADKGGTSSAIMNAANEIAVGAFLNKQIGFLQIAQVIEHALTQCSSQDMTDLDAVMRADAEARVEAQSVVERYTEKSGVIH